MSKQNLILLPSEKMDINKKVDRNENSLIRMSSSVRVKMGFSDDSVEIWGNEDTSKGANGALMLTIFKAFSEDVKKVKKLVADGILAPEDVSRVGFVTSKIYKRITGKVPEPADRSNIWISNGIVDIMMGADPEFILMKDDGSSIVSANTVPGFTKYSPIGHDGAMAELRPAPATTPEKLVENIKILLSDDALTANIKKYRWLAGTYYKNAIRDFPVGGHIHIGNPIKIDNMDQQERELFFIAFNKILDELLALPFIRLDGAKGKSRRTECNMGQYGYFGEYRVCNGRLEYRTLSGMWLSHPKLAELLFGTTKAIIEEVYKFVTHNKFDTKYVCSKLCSRQIFNGDFDSWVDIPLTRDMGCIKSSQEMRALLNASSLHNINKPFINAWYKHIQSFSSYNKYSKYIDGLFSLISRSGKELNAISTDIKENWLEGKELNI